jgi:hypothetical protein
MVDYRQAAYLFRGHDLERRAQMVVRMAHDRRPTGDVAHFDFASPLIPCAECDTDVPVGNHSTNLAFVIDHGELPTIVFPHECRGDCQIRIGVTGGYGFIHHILDSHSSLLRSHAGESNPVATAGPSYNRYLSGG